MPTHKKGHDKDKYVRLCRERERRSCTIIITFRLSPPPSPTPTKKVLSPGEGSRVPFACRIQAHSDQQTV